MSNLDSFDRMILSVLQQDAMLTTKEIAEKINLSTTPVFERIKRLERDGYIRQYVALLDKQKIGKNLTAYCNVSLKEHAKEYLEKFEQEIAGLEEVMECHHIAGMYDYLLKVVVDNMEAYQRFIVNTLATLDNIGRVQSSFVMSEIKHTTAFKV